MALTCPLVFTVLRPLMRVLRSISAPKASLPLPSAVSSRNTVRRSRYGFRQEITVRTVYLYYT